MASVPMRIDRQVASPGGIPTRRHPRRLNRTIRQILAATLRTAHATPLILLLVLVVNCGVLELFAFCISSAHADSAAFGIGRNDHPPFGSSLSCFLHDEIQCAIIDLGVGAHV